MRSPGPISPQRGPTSKGREGRGRRVGPTPERGVAEETGERGPRPQRQGVGTIDHVPRSTDTQ